MKKLVSFLLFLFFSLNMVLGQKIDFSLIKNYSKTGVISDMAVNWLSFDDYNGTNYKLLTPKDWRQLYTQLQKAAFKYNLNDVVQVKRSSVEYLRKKILPIGIIDFRYEKIKEGAIENNLLQISDNKLVPLKDNFFETQDLFAVSLIHQREFTGKNVKFLFPQKYYFTNQDKKIDYLLVDFDDGNGWKKVYVDKIVEVQYKEEGKKHIKVQAYYKDGSVKKSEFEVSIKESKAPQPYYYWDNFTADIPYNGEYATGDVAIYFGDSIPEMKRPVILMDGFDPGDQNIGIEELYNIGNQQGLFDTLLARGYDAILVNAHDGAGYIQKNAMLLVKVIQMVNSMLEASGNVVEANQIVCIGPSMAGLITRYALDYMEMNNMHHNVRTYISFDSPQRGANIPLGVQHWIRFFADEADNDGAKEAKAALDEYAAQEMLIYHYTATNGTTADANSLFDAFYNEINAMGFPQQPRVVSIINGAGYGNGMAFQPGEKVIEYYYRSFLVDLDGDVWAVPDSFYTQIFEGLYNPIGTTNESEDIYVNNTAPYDNAPGGTLNTFQILDETSTGGYGDIIAFYDNHCFIPTISSLCLTNITEPGLNVDQNLDIIQTPFDTLYYQTWNQPHMLITDTTAKWFFFEIYNFKPKFISSPTITSIDEGENYFYQIVVRDSNYWNNLTISAEKLPSWLTLDPQTKTLYGTPSNEDVGTHLVILKVSDGLDSSIQSFQIQVNNVNDPPYFTSEPVTEVDEDTWYIYILSAEDIDPTNDQLTFSLIKAPDWLELNEQNILIGIPSNADVGSDTVIVEVSDGMEAAQQTFVITVNNVNDAPIFQTNPITTILEDQNYAYFAKAIDIDPTNDIVNLFVVEKPEWLTFENDTLFGVPTNDEVGLWNVKLAATDGLDTSYQAFQINVINVNDPPILNKPVNDTFAIVDTLFIYNLGDSVFYDVDKDDYLYYEAMLSNGNDLPQWLYFDNVNLEFSGTPSDTATYFILLSATDNADATTFDIFKLRVYQDAQSASVSDTKLNFTLYPNPVKDFLNILLPQGTWQVNLISLEGKTLIEKQFENFGQLDLSQYPSGTYILKFNDGKHLISLKIQKI